MVFIADVFSVLVVPDLLRTGQTEQDIFSKQFSLGGFNKGTEP
jgi:hypothetical protein